MELVLVTNEPTDVVNVVQKKVSMGMGPTDHAQEKSNAISVVGVTINHPQSQNSSTKFAHEKAK